MKRPAIPRAVVPRARATRARPLLALAPVALATLALACSNATGVDVGGLRPSETRLSSGLAIAVVAAPSAVAAGDSVTARLTVRNPTSAVIRVTSGCAALAGLALLKVAPPTQAPVESGFSTACATVETTFTVAAGDSVVYTLRAPTTSLDTGAPLPTGAYEIGAYSHTAGDQLIGPADGPLPNATALLALR